MLWNALLLALREIRRNLMRASLTVLGIIIGVAAVITMVTLGNGATALITAQVASLGSNLVIVRPGQRMSPGQPAGWAPAFKEEDMQAILEAVHAVREVAGIAQRGSTVAWMTESTFTPIVGSTPSYLEVGNWKIAEGRFFNDSEQRAGRALCVLGDTVKKALFSGSSPIGEKIRTRGVSCEVIGVLAPKGQSAMGQDQDDIVLMPLKAYQRRIAGRRSRQDVGTLLLSVRDGLSTERVVRDVSALMRERRGIAPNENDNFSVFDTRQISDALSSTTRVLTALLGAVAAVSLLVGGIGIMNIMLVSVTERTREIGTRLAIGALEREVLLQFLVEAVALSAFGGLVGIALALVASFGLTSAMGLPFVLDFEIMLLAFAVSAGIGVLFGFVPARRAARLDPIEALRHE
ncbi:MULTISPECIES: ABC transporter permease [unclassified Uliginosibacterium]|uniref:ABC transporter permease n=1 Tax=unclassified Uliginosibacterium TaxID=2621521 RepID=UPI00156FC8F2|nr:MULTISPECIES: ABC transporter permease [unclassified Uliginosibacterium]MDO6386231.1 ABC transporter permease [Uliginosibacterium sp. 31-12]